MRLIMVAALLVLTDSHVILLQTVAWARMLVVYSQTVPLRTAWIQTFDGEHPCPLCLLIAKSRTPPQQQELQQLTNPETEWWLEIPLEDESALPYFQLREAVCLAPPTRSDPPPVPPPRSPSPGCVCLALPRVCAERG
ncbi:MAG: hypothetical protein NTY53_23860 [Kiritimatiellaeota bacterium]|nr:hypothetical protein [Kiritimatiellota bacterium]